MLALYNQGEFRQERFDGSRVINASTIHSQYSGTDRAQWCETKIMKHSFQDEVEYLQLGQVHE